jgi:hypothetical protein
MAVDVDAVSRALQRFIQSHRTQFHRLSDRQSQLLEIGALSISAKHYELSGYEVRTRNIVRGAFRVKLSSSGKPWNFSWFEATRGRTAVEIHGNLPVQDGFATRGARYVVDVAVIQAGSLPQTATDQKKWTELTNGDLVTFLEAKALVIYPMLIAQFVGIVHELKPDFLLGQRPRGFKSQDHFDPALVSLGYTHGTCGDIVSGLKRRRCYLRVVEQFDVEIAKLRSGDEKSPLA